MVYAVLCPNAEAGAASAPSIFLPYLLSC